MNAYWYDVKSNSVTIISLPGGCTMGFSQSPFTAMSSNVTIYINYEFNLFSNHICSLDSWGTINPKLTYFEPAAKLNREMVRNFAKKIVESTGMIPDFSTHKNRVIPYDLEYGYLDDADYRL